MLSYIGNAIVNAVWGWAGIGGVVAIIAWALWWLEPEWIGQSRRNLVLHIAVIATAFSLSWGVAATKGFNNGYTKALIAVEKRSAKVSASGESAWKDVKSCFEDGGEWNVETDRCDR